MHEVVRSETVERRIAVFVGSLRRESTANWRMRSWSLRHAEIGQLPLYNQDSDQNPPQAFVEFRERVKAAEAVLFVTPEHNRSVPPALKNALDVASRHYGQSVWNGKPGAVISASVPLADSGPTICASRSCT
jgi:chromate reductase